MTTILAWIYRLTGEHAHRATSEKYPVYHDGQIDREV